MNRADVCMYDCFKISTEAKRECCSQQLKLPHQTDKFSLLTWHCLTAWPRTLWCFQDHSNTYLTIINYAFRPKVICIEAIQYYHKIQWMYVALARLELSAFLWLAEGCCFLNPFIHSSPVVLFSSPQILDICEVANALHIHIHMLRFFAACS